MAMCHSNTTTCILHLSFVFPHSTVPLFPCLDSNRSLSLPVKNSQSPPLLFSNKPETLSFYNVKVLMSLSRKTSSVLPSPIVLFLLLCLVLQRTKAASTDFDFGTLTLSGLKLLGDAHLDNGCVRLTRDLAVPNSGAGKVFYSKPIRFRQPSAQSIASFSTFFSFSVTNLNPSSIGGGLAFVISPDSDNLGAAGGFLGLLNIDEGPQAASTFVAVEFDTLMDVEFKDINGNHVGLDLNSMVSAQIGDLGAINIDLKSGDLVNAWIDYDGPNQIFNISVSYSNLKPKEPILSFSLDLDQYVNDFMYVGFSGSTQGSTETHSIEWWSFSSSFQSSLDSESSSSVPPPPTASLMNPTANSVKSPPPTLAPSGLDSVSGKSAKSNSCHNQLCKQGAGAVAGVVTASAFFVIFAGVLIWVFSKRFKHVKKPVSIASEWVWSLHREGRLLMAADARLVEEEEEGQYEEDEMRRVLLVGLACSHPDPMARPTMRGVVQMLVGEAEVPLVPRTKPAMSFSTSHLLLSLQDSVSDCNGIIALSSSSSENSFNGGHDPLV
ncbi:hypothetical protein OIU85_016641 [Salix viminalis]|uniref:Legume lectin domain-containing protein n=1 Tax=Salix viminalis TaxID=40686 RepID=A0A9Q0V6F9_SALVM|nr:hypothetical protein OIU85_016641 [Salix viminalis]